MKPARWVQPLLLAVVLTGLNAAKPLHIDDTQYFQYAAHSAAHPLDPYGFEVLFFQWPEPAIELLNPLGLTYWLAGGMALFGSDPTVLKLTLFPFLLLFALGVSGLLQRFVGRCETPLLWMVGLSPVVLPGINLMLDLPALAWMLCALNVFFAACDAGSAGRAALAGVIAGVAMQTKYSALVGPGVMLVYALVHRKVHLGLLAGAVAAGVFGAVEAAVFAHYGRSHFLVQLVIDDPFQRNTPKLAMLLPLVTNAGAMACSAALLGLAAVRRRAGPLVPWLAVAILCAHTALLFAPVGLALFLLLGLFFWAVAIAVVRGLLSGGERPGVAAGWRAADPATRFLVGWLGLEIVGYFILSPFPATRRMTVLFLLMVLLAARVLARGPAAELRRVVLAASALTVALGLVYFGVDLLEARATREGVERAAARIRTESPGSDLWFVGHWGFHHHAERAGMRPVVPDFSRLREGDWLVVNTRVPRQALAGDPERLVLEDRIVVDDSIPLATVPDYYAGVWPLHHRDEPRVRLLLLRAAADVVPRTGLPPEAVIEWARERAPATARVAAPALLDIVVSGDAEHAPAAAAALDALVPALRAARDGDDSELRAMATRVLEALASRQRLRR